MDFTYAQQLHYLIHFVDGEYVAHCLDLDLVGSGGNVDASVAELNAAVQSLVLFSMRNESWASNIKLAPSRYWEMFESAKKSGKTEVRTFEISPELAPVMVKQCHFKYCMALMAA